MVIVTSHHHERLPDHVVENKDGIYKAVFHVPLFVGLQLVVRSSLLCCHSKSAISTPRKKASTGIIQNIRAIMLSQDIHLVADDFNGTAWCCRSRDNLSAIDEACTDFALSTPLAPHHCGELDPSRIIGLRLRFSQPFLALSVCGRSISMLHHAFSIRRQALGLRPSDQSCHHNEHFIMNVSSIRIRNGTIKRTTSGTHI